MTFEPTGYIVAPVNAQDLKSVILNLVVNALDSMDEGLELRLAVKTSAATLHVVGIRDSKLAFLDELSEFKLEIVGARPTMPALLKSGEDPRALLAR